MDREKGAVNRADLAERWKRLMRTDAPTAMPMSLLALAVAYREQEKTHGALKPAIARQLLEGPKPVGKSAAAPRSGTVLVREWHGVRYTATVLDKGVAFNGKHYRSLSHVAKVITGNHWSGPAFFGFKAKIGPRHD